VSACPYLGLSDDPTLMLSEPSPAHRCLAVRPAKSPNEAWQSNHCLIGEHVRCEYYSAAESDPQRRRQAKATGRARRHKTGAGSRVFVALLGALLLGLLVAVAVWGAGGQVQALALLGGMVKGAAPVPEATQPATVAGEGSEEATVAVQVTLPAAPTTPPPPTAVPASATPTETPTPTPKRDIVPGSRVLPDEGRVLGDSEARRVTLPVADALHASVDGQMAMAVAEQHLAVSANSATSPTSTQAATPTPTMTPSPTAAQAKAASPTPSAEATLHVLSPGARDTGWWTDDPERPGEVGDSFLYVGQLAYATFISAVRFDLLGVPRGAPLLDGEFTLTGLNDERFNREVPAIFRVQMIAESELASFDGTDFISVFSAPASITSLRDLPSVESQVGATNRWTLDANVLRWLEQELLNGAGSVTFRLSAVALPAGEETLFAWDSGFGRKTQGMGPALMLKAGSPPPTPPPLPTREYLVATLTPVPANVMTAVAHQATATAMAQTVGTYTPMPAFVTPTPLPTNLATLQANALAQGLPAVVVNTPVPANDAEATEMAARATAVAVTTGTYTPVPTLYVTPFVVVPSPPAENTATAVARLLEQELAREVALETPTPLPHNAIVGEFVLATPTPANVATAAVISLAATADAQIYGPATATPFHWIVITATPVPLPTWTPTLKPVIFESEFTPTPIPAPTESVPTTLPGEYRNLIFFKRGEGEWAETWLVNPETGESGRVTREWLYPLAKQQLTLSPDGKFQVFVRSNDQGIPEIYIHSVEWGSDRKITFFSEPSYDPAWSPTGEWIAFVSSNSGNDEIYRISPDGSKLEQLTSNDWEWDKHPSWSPDGSRITFFSNRETGKTQIWVMNADGSGAQRVVTSDESDMYPVWAR